MVGLKKWHGNLFIFIAALFLSAFATGARADPVSGDATGRTMTNAWDEKALVEAAQAMRRAGVVRLNFEDIALLKFVRFMAELLQENIVLPPDLKGTITLIAPQPCSLQEARQIMISALQVNGWDFQEMGGYGKIVPGSRPSR